MKFRAKADIDFKLPGKDYKVPAGEVFEVEDRWAPHLVQWGLLAEMVKEEPKLEPAPEPAPEASTSEKPSKKRG